MNSTKVFLFYSQILGLVEIRSKSLYEAAEKTSSFMIRFPTHDLKCAIYLFHQDDFHHLVWEGHFAE